MRSLNKYKILKKPSKLKNDIRMVFILVIYLVLGIILFRYYQYQINNDGIVYIGISKTILNGNFYSSINSYWGPFFSWLMLPFLYFSQTPVEAIHSTKILSLTLGFFTIIGIRQFSYRFVMDEIIRTTILLISIPVILYFALNITTPDLLVVCISIYYLTIIFDINYPKKLSNGLMCGILGGLAFLTKSYGLIFFLFTFLFFNFLHYLRNSDSFCRKNVIKNLLIGFSIFLLISGVWAAVISNKDGKLTFGTSGEFNHALVGPNSNGFADYNEGIHNPNQINTNFMPKDWSPFSSWRNFKYQLTLIWNNTIKTGVILNYFSCLSILIILIYILIFIYPPKNLISKIDLLYPLITILAVMVGYLVIIIEERYLWLIYILLMLMGGYLINLLFNKTDLFTKRRLTILLKLIILIGFAILFVIMPINYLAHNLNIGKDSYTLSNTLTNQYGVHGKIATNDKLTEMNYLAYYMNTTLYGQSQKNISSSELRSDLKNYGIEYYFIWGNSNQSFYLSGDKEITSGKINNLEIYQIT
jgi:hypothetical protein